VVEWLRVGGHCRYVSAVCESVLSWVRLEYAVLKQLAVDYANAVTFREVGRPYHYETKVRIEGKDAVSMVSTLELYSHVQTASRLGYDTRLEAVNGRIQVVFEKKLPLRPGEFCNESTN
jgi:hypothetical protein